MATAATAVSAAQVERLRIESKRDFKRVEKLLNESVAAKVEVTIAPGRYALRDTFNIERSNVELRGEGQVLLQLARRAQAPVIAVGTQKEYARAADTISGIVISDLEIDGNKEYQKSEYDRNLPWIRNNGIDVRAVSGMVVERVASHNNRSGGLVISWGCSDVLVRECRFERNFFDGVAYYDSVRVFTIDSVMARNDGAGVSLDNEFKDSMFVRCELLANKDVGVFARHSARLVFDSCVIRDSGNWAFFLSHDENENGVFDVTVTNCEIVDNDGGLRFGSVTELQSANNAISRSRFSGNGRSGRPNVSTAGSLVALHEDQIWEETVVDPSDRRKRVLSDNEGREEALQEAILSIEGLNRG